MKENLIEKLFFPLMRIGLWCLAYAFISGILQILPLVFFRVNIQDALHGLIPVKVSLIGSILVFAGTFLYFLLLRPHFSGLSSIFKSRAFIAYGFGLGFILILSIFLFVVLFEKVKISISTTFTLFDLFASVLLFLCISLSEELFMRGVILRYLLATKNNDHISILISAIIFSFFHILNPNINVLGIINIFFAGIILAQLFIYSDFSIWASIGLHWAWNFFQSSMFGFSVSGMKIPSFLIQQTGKKNIINGGNFGLEGSIITVFIMLIAIIYLFYWKTTRKEIQDNNI